MDKHLAHKLVQLAALLASLAIALNGDHSAAQEGSLMLSAPSTQPLTLQNGSFIYRELPPEMRPRQLEERDIVTVIVNYNSRLLSEGDAESRKTSNIAMVLADWLRFDGKSIKAAPQNDGDPTIAGNYNSQYRAESDVELRDSLTFKIACEIIEILPNGNLRIEGDVDIQINEEHWQIYLSGTVPREAIQPDRTVSGESVAHLNIDKRERGQVRDGYARGWFTRWFDRYKPF